MNHRSEWIKPEQAQEALQRGTGRGIKIAVLDSGIELSHPRLEKLQLADDLAFRSNEDGTAGWEWGEGRDVYGHGTAIADIIHRTAPDAIIGSFRILDERLSCHPKLVQEAANRAIDAGYDILSCSLGVRADAKTFQYFKSWVDHAYLNGVHIVSACSNNSFRTAEWPGAFPTVITVNMANTQSTNMFYRWESKRPHLVEFSTQGVEVEAAWKDGTLRQCTGSSYAAPKFAATLAQLLSIYPQLKTSVAKALLQETSRRWTPDIVASNG